MRWRPSLRFYNERIAILREFEQRGDLVAFGVEENRVGARVLTRRNQLSVHQDGLTVALWGPDADVNAAWELIGLALDRLSPGPVGGLDVRLQHVVPLDLPFEEAAAKGFAEIIRMPSSDDVNYTDWACALDFRAPEMMKGRCEFGIIRNLEAPGRLEGSIGREGRSAWAASNQEPVLPSEFPEVALFLDSRWLQDSRQESEDHAEIRDFWMQARKRAGDVVDELYAKIRNQGSEAEYMRGETG
jgi:hypothetical protein